MEGNFPPLTYTLVRCFNVMWWGAPFGTSTGIIAVKKWGDFAPRQRGYDANGGVTGHDSRRQATTTKEDTNNEV